MAPNMTSGIVKPEQGEDAMNTRLKNRISSFMNANYPCDCAPNDPECDKNNSETQYIIEIFAEELFSAINLSPKYANRDELKTSIERMLFHIESSDDEIPQPEPEPQIDLSKFPVNTVLISSSGFENWWKFTTDYWVSDIKHRVLQEGLGILEEIIGTHPVVLSRPTEYEVVERTSDV